MANTKGGVLTKSNNNVAKPTSIKGLIIAMQGQIKKALPSVMTPERFSRIAMTAVATNPKLAQCTPQSFLGAMMQAAQLGVEPNTPLGQAYLIPYRNKGVLETQFQLGYKGLIDLAYRSGAVTDIQAHEVYENDDFEYELGLHPQLRHKPKLTNRGEVILFYAVFHTKDGGYGFEVMSVEDIQEHAKKYSKARDYSPWKTNFIEMAKKTVLKRCLKYAPLKTEFVRGLAADETIKSKISEQMDEIADETTIDIENTAMQDETEGKDEKAQSVPNNVDPETGEIKDNAK